MVCMADTKTVKASLAKLARVGCVTKFNKDAGTATATDGDVCVYRALEAVRGTWVVRCKNSDRVKWV